VTYHIILPKIVALPKNRTVEKWTKSIIFVTPKTERDEEVKTFRHRSGKAGSHDRRYRMGYIRNQYCRYLWSLMTYISGANESL